MSTSGALFVVDSATHWAVLSRSIHARVSYRADYLRNVGVAAKTAAAAASQLVR